METMLPSSSSARWMRLPPTKVPLLLARSWMESRVPESIRIACALLTVGLASTTSFPFARPMRVHGRLMGMLVCGLPACESTMLGMSEAPCVWSPSVATAGLPQLSDDADSSRWAGQFCTDRPIPGQINAARSVENGLLAQLFAQLPCAFFQPVDLRHRRVHPFSGGAGLLEVEGTLERTFGIPADRRELRAEVADIDEGFGGHRSLPRRNAPMHAVFARRAR
jgi:hypothetical protein